MMDLKRLKHITVLAEERNFSRAAERVNLSQPAFSRSVQAAEAELGLRLFDRGGAQVTCTTAGAAWPVTPPCFVSARWVTCPWASGRSPRRRCCRA